MRACAYIARLASFLNFIAINPPEGRDFVDLFVHQATNSSQSSTPFESSSSSATASASSDSENSAPRKSTRLPNSPIEMELEPSTSNFLNTFLAITSCCLLGFGCLEILVCKCKFQTYLTLLKLWTQHSYLFNHQSTHSNFSKVPEESESIFSIASSSSDSIGRPISSHNKESLSVVMKPSRLVFWLFERKSRNHMNRT